MNKSDELLQRCFDNDLNDEEMQILFAELSGTREMRKQFRFLQELKMELRSNTTIQVPSSLDERIRSLILTRHRSNLPDASPLRRIISRKFTISVPAFVATVLFLFVGAYFAAANVIKQKTETEYVYIVEMPPYVVQSKIYETVNN